jgi:hypothetical protein
MFSDDHRGTHLIIHFERIIGERYGPFVRDYCDILLNRIHPIFDDIRESDAPVAENLSSFWRYKRGRMLLGGSNEEKLDYSGYWGIGIDDWEITDMQAVFLAIGITGLFHLFEKQLYEFINRQLRIWLLSPICHWAELSILLDKFDRRALVPGRCTELIDVFKNSDLIELVLVSNAVKHGGGKSYDKLVELGSQVVSKRRFLESGTVSILNRPLSVDVGDLIRYQDAIARFWTLEGMFYAHPSSFKGVRPSPDWSLLY